MFARLPIALYELGSGSGLPNISRIIPKTRANKQNGRCSLRARFGSTKNIYKSKSRRRRVFTSEKWRGRLRPNNNNTHAAPRRWPPPRTPRTCSTSSRRSCSLRCRTPSGLRRQPLSRARHRRRSGATLPLPSGNPVGPETALRTDDDRSRFFRPVTRPNGPNGRHERVDRPTPKREKRNASDEVSRRAERPRAVLGLNARRPALTIGRTTTPVCGFHAKFTAFDIQNPTRSSSSSSYITNDLCNNN